MSDETEFERKGDYEILGVLGTGGMGKVYKVRNILSDRIEAMKVLLPNLSGQKELADRFLREIKVLASLNHSNIAVLRTALMIDNQLVMIMEYLEGTTLAARLEQETISWRDALTYIDQVLAALSYAHQQNVIHRDIKPANMMLTPSGAIKLMDFGIAWSGNDLGLAAAADRGQSGSARITEPNHPDGHVKRTRTKVPVGGCVPKRAEERRCESGNQGSNGAAGGPATARPGFAGCGSSCGANASTANECRGTSRSLHHAGCGDRFRGSCGRRVFCAALVQDASE